MEKSRRGFLSLLGAAAATPIAAVALPASEAAVVPPEMLIGMSGLSDKASTLRALSEIDAVGPNPGLIGRRE